MRDGLMQTEGKAEGAFARQLSRVSAPLRQLAAQAEVVAAEFFTIWSFFKKITFGSLDEVNSTLDPRGRRHNLWRRGYTSRAWIHLITLLGASLASSVCLVQGRWSLFLYGHGDKIN
jgi:hypothetical protein